MQVQTHSDVTVIDEAVGQLTQYPLRTDAILTGIRYCSTELSANSTSPVNLISLSSGAKP